MNDERRGAVVSMTESRAVKRRLDRTVRMEGLRPFGSARRESVSADRSRHEVVAVAGSSPQIGMLIAAASTATVGEFHSTMRRCHSIVPHCRRSTWEANSSRPRCWDWLPQAVSRRWAKTR